MSVHLLNLTFYCLVVLSLIGLVLFVTNWTRYMRPKCKQLRDRQISTSISSQERSLLRWGSSAYVFVNNKCIVCIKTRGACIPWGRTDSPGLCEQSTGTEFIGNSRRAENLTTGTCSSFSSHESDHYRATPR